MQMMDRVKDPNVWAALGYEMPVPEPARIEHKVDEREAPNTPPRLAFPVPPATPPQMKLLSNAVLRGDKMSENRWAGKGKPFSTPQWRKLMGWMEHPDRKYARFVDPQHPKIGRTLTKKGTDFMLFYADEEIKKLFTQTGSTEGMRVLSETYHQIEQ
jgi:hypothetical protein